MIEKSVSSRGRRIGAKDGVRIGGLGNNSVDFVECVESTTEKTDSEYNLSIITELINLLQ